MADQCPSLTFSPDSLVAGTMSGLYEFASQSYILAQTAFMDLSAFTVPPFLFNATYNLNDSLPGFQMPVAPPRPTESLAFLPPLPITEQPDSESYEPDFSDAPKFPNGLSQPNLNFGRQPGDFDVADPGNAPALTVVTLPPEPTLADPTKPELIPLDLPTPPPITIPEFTAVAPVRDFDAVDNTFNYTETEYTSALLNTVKARLQTMLQGGTGLPLAIEQALFDRGAEREERETFRAIQEAENEWAGRGFDQPPGAMIARVNEVRQQATSRRAGLSRDILIRVHEVAIENLRFSVTQGIALEQVLLGAHMAIQDRLLQAQKLTLEASINVLNARIAMFNADQEAYKTAAQVYRDRIEGQRALVELYKAQIEGEKAKGEINQTLASIYETETRALSTMVQVYVAKCDAKKIENEINMQRIEAYKAKVQAYEARVGAYSAEWQGYTARVQAESEKVRSYEIGVNAFAARVRAWGEEQRTEIAKGGFSISEKDFELRAWLGQIERYRADLQAEIARVTSVTQVYGADAQMFETKGGLEASRQETNNRQLALMMDQERTRKEIMLKNADLQIQQIQQTAGLILEKLKGLASIGTSLTSASMSAMNISANIAASNSSSCNTSFSYTYEGVD